MKIIEPGIQQDEKGTRRFECKKCRCVFEMDRSEYKEFLYRKRSEYYAICPNCREFVKVVEERCL